LFKEISSSDPPVAHGVYRAIHVETPIMNPTIPKISINGDVSTVPKTAVVYIIIILLIMIIIINIIIDIIANLLLTLLTL
jgi:hypothetical protein